VPLFCDVVVIQEVYDWPVSVRREQIEPSDRPCRVLNRTAGGIPSSLPFSFACESGLRLEGDEWAFCSWLCYLFGSAD